MKIICIGRNYADHAREMKSELPQEPVFFMKPDSAILQRGKAFFIPDFSNDVHYELEIVVKINRLGKNIEERFAHRYYNEVNLGIDFTARDLQAECKKKGLPWEKAKAFDGSAPLGQWMKLETLGDGPLTLELKKNGETVQRSDSSQMIFSIDQLISYVSRFVTLKIGDLIFTGTPSGVGPVAIGDQLEGYLNGKRVLRVPVK